MSKKINKKIICEECDSEYQLKFEFGMTSETTPIYCTFCGVELELEDEDEEE